MSRLLRLYQGCMASHPWKTQIITAGLLNTTGDVLAQFVIERRTIDKYDWKRSLRFMLLGSFFIAPVVGVWYKLLAKHVTGSPRIQPLKMVLVDQLAFSPVMLTTLLFILPAMEFKSFAESYHAWRTDFTTIFVTGLQVWPATQLLNFYLVPLAYRLVVVQFVALFWNTYLSWKTQQPKDYAKVEETEEQS